jgi:hypothetical protein
MQISFVIPTTIAAGLLWLVISIFKNPDLVEKWKAILFKPLASLGKSLERAYVGADVAYNVTTFLNKSVIGKTTGGEEVKVQVQWVTANQESAFKNDGTLILRLKRKSDELENVLNAASCSLPQVVCPHIRAYLDPAIAKTLDLALLKKLSQSIGSHATVVFQDKFFVKEIMKDQAHLMPLYSDHVSLDNEARLIPIYLTELTVLGELLFVEGSDLDPTEQVRQFLKFLAAEARRELHEEVPLEFVSPHIKVGLVLVAKSATAITQGASPYLQAFEIKLKRGCTSIYFVLYKHCLHLGSEIARGLDKDSRVFLVKQTDLAFNRDDGSRDHLRIMHYRTIGLVEE